MTDGKRAKSSKGEEGLSLGLALPISSCKKPKSASYFVLVTITSSLKANSTVKPFNLGEPFETPKNEMRYPNNSLP